MNPFDPNPNDARDWFYCGDKYPDQDWLLFLCNGACDSVIYEAASDMNCKNKTTAINALYMLTGDYCHTGRLGDYHDRLMLLIKKSADSNDPAIVKWAEESRQVISNVVPFDYDYWCFHDLTN